MIRCREVAELVGTDRLSELGFSKRIQVRLHLWMCVHCRRLRRQIARLREAAKELVDSLEAAQPSGELEERTLRRISGN